MNRKKTIIVIGIMLITTFIVTAFAVIKARKIKENSIKWIPTIQESYVVDDNTTNDEFDTSEQTNPSPTSEPLATPILPSTTTTPTYQNTAIANITISTDKKTKTYDIMPNVDEKTLKKNIGYLPSSAYFGEIGSCILMAHRDTDFSILKYAKIGDVFTVTDINSKTYNYKVTSIEIIESASELKFTATSDPTLVLVTCYPFRYTGHAPQKYVVKCILL